MYCLMQSAIEFEKALIYGEPVSNILSTGSTLRIYDPPLPHYHKNVAVTYLKICPLTVFLIKVFNPFATGKLYSKL